MAGSPSPASGSTALPGKRARARVLSLRNRLLTYTLIPVCCLTIVNGVLLYHRALDAVNVAYDRTLLASAKSIGEQLDVIGWDDAAQIVSTVPYAALETFEADTRSHMVYRVSTLDGGLVAGYARLNAWHGTLPTQPPYATLVDFYDDSFDGEPVRVAVLLQPVVNTVGRAMAVVQVAETLQLRRALARQVLADTLWREALLLLVIGLVLVWGTERAMRPLYQLSRELRARPQGDLRPVAAGRRLPRELRPIVAATNTVLERLHAMVTGQRRFVRDASHQLRTPLAVLKVQVQSAQRGDAPVAQSLEEIAATVDRAIRLANQMLSLAKVDQMGGDVVLEEREIAQDVRSIALELGPLVAQRRIEFSLETDTVRVRAHEWMVRELTRNLLHNAIVQTPTGGQIGITVVRAQTEAILQVADSGPGMSPEVLRRAGQAFAGSSGHAGAGLGLAICKEIVRLLDGRLVLENRVVDGQITGLDARVILPIAEQTHGPVAH